MMNRSGIPIELGLRILVLLTIGFVVQYPLFPKQEWKSEVSVILRMEQQLFDLINTERKQAEKGSLQMDLHLRQIARSHSHKMAEMNELSHFFRDWPAPQQKLIESGLFFLDQAENVAVSTVDDSQGIHRKLIESITHRLNILNERFTHCGIGVVKAGNRFYVAQEFASFYSPNAEETIQVQIENMISDWFRRTQGKPLVIAPEFRLKARVLAHQSLLKVNYPIELDAERKVTVVRLVFPEIDPLFKEIEKTMPTLKYSAIAVSVVHGRNSEFSGGTYVVTLLFLD